MTSSRALAALGGALLLLAVPLLFGGCSGSGGKLIQARTVTPAAPVAPYTGGARIAFEEGTLDFGDVALEQWVRATFHFRNVGNEPLVVRNASVRVVEGCCPPEAKAPSSPIPPGGSGFISFEFTMHKGMGGPHLLQLAVRSNDPEDPESLVYVRANYPH